MVLSIRYVFLLILTTLPSLLGAQFYYGHRQNFGKNRVVYKPQDWGYFRFPHFDVYYYKNSVRESHYVSYEVLKARYEFEALFSGPIPERLIFLVFNSISYLKQSNLNGDAQKDINNAKNVQILDNKVMLTATGERADLKTQIRKGLLYHFLPLWDISPKNKKHPGWIFYGLQNYLARHPNEKDYWFAIDRYRNEKDFQIDYFKEEEEASKMGIVFWDFIRKNYGSETVLNIARNISKSVDFKEAFWKVIHLNYDHIQSRFSTYLNKLSISATQNKLQGKRRVKRSYSDEKIYQVALSGDYSRVAYAINELGEYSIHIANLKQNTSERIFLGGYKVPQNEDFSYPKIAWHPSGEVLCFMMEEELYPYLVFYDVRRKTYYKKEFYNIRKILDFSFSEKGDRIVISGVSKGFTDLFVYSPKTHVLDQITKDSYEDIHPIFYEGSSKILFLSNRPSDTLVRSSVEDLGRDRFDVFVYDYSKKNEVLSSLPVADDEAPQSIKWLPYDHFGVLTRSEGQATFYAYEVDSNLVTVDTTEHYDHFFKRRPLTHAANYIGLDANHLSKNWVDIRLTDYDYEVRWSDKVLKQVLLQKQTEPVRVPSETRSRDAPEKKHPTPASETIDTTAHTVDFVDLDRYAFYPEVLRLIRKESGYVDPDSLFYRRMLPKRVFDVKSMQGFKRLFELSFFVTDLDHSLQNNLQSMTYEIYNGSAVQGGSQGGGLGLVSFWLKDIFEDYILGLSFSLPSGLPQFGFSLIPNNELQLTIKDRYHRLNKAFYIYRKSTFAQSVRYLSQINTVTYKATVQLTYPFTPVFALQGTTSYRHDDTHFLSKDVGSALLDALASDYSTLNLALIYDNVLPLGKNLKHGFQAKVFAEWMQGFENRNQTLINFGLDARYFYRIHRNWIWANRLAYGGSVSHEKLIYYIGGIDNEFFPNFNRLMTPDPANNYTYQTLMTNVRGFDQNVRNGNHSIVLSVETRFPVVQYFYRRPLDYEVISHFQVVPFFDLGTAWSGLTPWSNLDQLGHYKVSKGSIEVNIEPDLSAWVAGYGVGLRTSFLGYFLRLDYAYGIDSYEIRGPVFHFTLSQDF